MAYIGIDPNVGDITFQKFSGTGSATSFTLSQSVASGEAIIVTVGNVIQEPGVTASYTAQGTTLTFSEAPANGDDIVVRFLGRAIDQPLSFAMQVFKYVATSNQTAFTGADSAGAVLAFGSDVDVYLNGVHLDTTDFTLSGGDTVTLASGATVNDELVVRAFRAFAATDTVSKASGGAFTGAITATGGLNVGTIKEVTNTNTALTINSSGHILTPARPSFKVRRTDSSNVGHTGQVNFNAVDSNVGSHYDTSSYHFLVPITGLYSFQFVGFTASSSGGGNVANTGVQAEIQKSSASNFSSLTVIGHSYAAISSSASHQVLNIACIEELTAGEYVRLFVAAGHIFSDESSNQQYDPMFSGFLVG